MLQSSHPHLRDGCYQKWEEPLYWDEGPLAIEPENTTTRVVTDQFSILGPRRTVTWYTGAPWEEADKLLLKLSRESKSTSTIKSKWNHMPRSTSMMTVLLVIKKMIPY